MNQTAIPFRKPSQSSRRFLDRTARSFIFRKLKSLQKGRLVLREGETSYTFGPDGEAKPEIEIQIHHGRFYRQLISMGSLGAAESYIRGDWTCNDLVALVRLFCRNRLLSARVEGPVAKFGKMADRLRHVLRRNTLSGSRRNIAAHYDLGNEFFSLFLDDTMAYSCAVFPEATSTLGEAQLEKYDRICRKLELSSEDHLLEIGTGWGGFAHYAASHYGCRITTTTISRKQHDYTKWLIDEAGLGARVDVLREDYRLLTGEYDKLVSIEMIESVGYHYFREYFRICSERLKPDGLMLLQAIVMADQHYERYRRSVDFIQRYIFPGGCLPSIQLICDCLAGGTDMRLVHLEDLTSHYAKTLDAWRERFDPRRDDIRRLGFSNEFLRMWEFYFSYCRGGFLERQIGDVQMLMAKPECRLDPITPPCST
jgi:cyclopropane-fatty-acyl-phospholipid synthase